MIVCGMSYSLVCEMLTWHTMIGGCDPWVLQYIHIKFRLILKIKVKLCTNIHTKKKKKNTHTHTHTHTTTMNLFLTTNEYLTRVFLFFQKKCILAYN